MEHESIGRIAISRAGRDKGRAFLIVAEDPQQADYVFVADGLLRKLAKPKKKKRKHLTMEPTVAETIRPKLLTGKQVFDAEIRSCLRTLGYMPNIGTEESELLV